MTYRQMKFYGPPDHMLDHLYVKNAAAGRIEDQLFIKEEIYHHISMFQEDDLATFDDGIKMTYLRCFLTGDALGSIICLYSSNVNYEVEVQRLKEHFERLYTVVTSVEWTREKFSDPIDRNVDAMTAETNLARLSFWQNKCCSLMKARSFRSGLEHLIKLNVTDTDRGNNSIFPDNEAKER
ncbi:hypothetical protein T08_6513, partial [Trichinella sp. T8]